MRNSSYIIMIALVFCLSMAMGLSLRAQEYNRYENDRDQAEFHRKYDRYKRDKEKTLEQARRCLPGGSKIIRYMGYGWVEFSLEGRLYMARIVDDKVETITPR